MNGLSFRVEPRAEDVEVVRDIVSSTGFFNDYEIPVAVELVQERLDKGVASEYFFVFADYLGQTVAYACFGPIACTRNSYDLYWIATHHSFRGQGIGTVVLAEVEREIAKLGGRGIYIETSSKPLYLPTQQFYHKSGYVVEAVLKDFYDSNDHKMVFTKFIR
ncbi:MAG: GNAT family N-acetyltransferase [Bacteroidales bacterium]|nr:GNAT family N-acetyltransferase [Bacteroidales bacterium]